MLCTASCALLSTRHVAAWHIDLHCSKPYIGNLRLFLGHSCCTDLRQRSGWNQVSPYAKPRDGGY